MPPSPPRTLQAHAERVTGLAWHPEASTSGRMESALALATGATDSSAKLWTEEGKLLRTLEGHTERLGRVAFHPMVRLLSRQGQCLLCAETQFSCMLLLQFSACLVMASSP